MNEPLIQFKDVTKKFGDQTILNKINIEFHKGEVTTILGKSGMGKTVILKNIIGLLEPDNGQILYNGQDLLSLNKKKRNLIKAKFGYMFQNVALFDSLTVFDNVALPLRETTRENEASIKAKVIDKLEKLDVAATVHKYPSQISGGMQKRVGLARALITDPDIVLFDEPTTGLDPIRKNAVFSMISHMQKKFGFTAIIVSHDIPEVLYISQKVIMLDSGDIILNCSPQEIHQSTNPIVVEFLKGSESGKDELTGLKTISQITDKYTSEDKTTAPSGSFFSIILFRINGLDKINEELGFVIGQKVIQHFAVFIEDYLRISGENSRYSDDMILTILPNTKEGMCQILVKKLEGALKDYENLPLSDCPSKISYSISAGVSESQDPKNLDKTVEKAKNDMKVIGFFEVS